MRGTTRATQSVAAGKAADWRKAVRVGVRRFGMKLPAQPSVPAASACSAAVRRSSSARCVCLLRFAIAVRVAKNQRSAQQHNNRHAARTATPAGRTFSGETPGRRRGTHGEGLPQATRARCWRCLDGEILKVGVRPVGRKLVSVPTTLLMLPQCNHPCKYFDDQSMVGKPRTAPWCWVPLLVCPRGGNAHKLMDGCAAVASAITRETATTERGPPGRPTTCAQNALGATAGLSSSARCQQSVRPRRSVALQVT